MSESKHTPGPWVFPESDLKDFDDTIPVWDERGDVVCAVWPMESELARESSEAIANARLIASAPDLLEAAEDFRDSVLRGVDLDGFDSDRINAVLSLFDSIIGPVIVRAKEGEA